jgi:hypothetical protein
MSHARSARAISVEGVTNALSEKSGLFVSQIDLTHASVGS